MILRELRGNVTAVSGENIDSGRVTAIRKLMRRMIEKNPKLSQPFKTAWSMIHSRGITKRWLHTTFTVVTVLLLITSITMIVMLRSYYYNGIEQGLRQRSSVTVTYFRSALNNGINIGNNNDFFDIALSFIDSFDDREKMELQFIDSHGDIIVSSNGFPFEKNMEFEDYSKALMSTSGVGAWAGRNSNGEHVLAVTRLIYRPAGASAGAVRYVVSLESVNDVLIMLTFLMIGLTVIIVFFMLLSGSYFVNSIVAPVKQITTSANQIARGDFDIRLQSAHDDEIGALVAAINTMAVELAGSEKMKNDFISTVSHELRTPLTAIKGWGETLRDVGTDDPSLTQKGMEIIITESERMCSIVEDLLDFSSIQSGRMNLNLERIDIVTETAQTVDLFMDRCVQEKRTLSFTEPEQPIYIAGDAARLKQVFVNIIDNAIKYTEEGGHIDIGIKTEEGWVSVCIKDDGCGIAKNDLKLVSKRFYKANMTKRGFGIGLALVDEITELHHGRLTIESTEGKGTVVTVTLPMSEV